MIFSYQKKLRHKIAPRLLFYILLFSGFITLIITATQLFFEYQRDVDTIYDQFVRIERSFEKQIAESLWFFNEKAIRLQLEGILNFRDIEYLELSGDGEISIAIGQKVSERTVEKFLPIIYISENTTREIGSLKIVASMTDVYSRLFNRLITILITQTIKTFMVTTFIYLLFHFLVIRHLATIDSYLRSYSIDNHPELLELNRKSSSPRDELDQVVSSINETSHKLIESYENLEKKVEERTQDLQESLEQVKVLSGLLPICSFCKKIRDDKGYWNQIESYIDKHSEAQFSHSICHECADKHYPDMDLYNDEES